MRTKLIIGITASIAAYKMPEIIRSLIQYGFDVKVILTNNASCMLSVNMLQSIIEHSKNQYSQNISDNNAIVSDVYVGDNISQMMYIDLAKWADIILIMPASANFIAKLANGFCDDLLSITCSAIKIEHTKILVSPSMNPYMWQNPIVQANIKKLELISQENNSYLHILSTEHGSTLCGDIGFGRMIDYPRLLAELNKIRHGSTTYQYIYQQNHIDTNNTLASLIITAGPIRESLDSVRFISNYSSGKMGDCHGYCSCQPKDSCSANFS